MCVVVLMVYDGIDCHLVCIFRKKANEDLSWRFMQLAIMLEVCLSVLFDKMESAKVQGRDCF